MLSESGPPDLRMPDAMAFTIATPITDAMRGGLL